MVLSLFEQKQILKRPIHAFSFSFSSSFQQHLGFLAGWTPDVKCHGLDDLKCLKVP